MEQRSKRDDWQQLIGTTHTARLMRGTIRLAQDAGIPADLARGVLEECEETEREVVERMLQEGRY